jgi:hypothetical protein
MKYKIHPKIYKISKKIGVAVFPSDNPKYKLEIYDADTGKFLYYGGANGYGDYFQYLQFSSAYALERRRLYMIRHQKEIEKTGSRGWVIAKLLWDA